MRLGVKLALHTLLFQESLSVDSVLKLVCALCTCFCLFTPASAEIMRFDSAPLGHTFSSTYVEDGIRMTTPGDTINIFGAPFPINSGGTFSNFAGVTEFQFDDGSSFDLVGLDAFNNGGTGSGTEFTVTGFLTAGGTITDTFLDPPFQGVSQPFANAAFVGLDRISIQRTDGDNEVIVYDNIEIVAASTAAVPEPSSFALLGLGCLAFAGYRRRTLKQAA